MGQRFLMLDGHVVSKFHRPMATPTDENFQDYKKAERKALELVAAMKTASAKTNDIELALLVAIFELHKGALPPETIAAIVQEHINQIIPFYKAPAESG